MSRFPDLPARMRNLPVDHRGFPVPWFVYWDGGSPVFPVADGRKAELAHRLDLCWVCGQQLGRVKAFVIGPMCAVNRTSSEPPSHLDCARFSARNCPFLTKPKMRRVGQHNLPHGVQSPAGEMIERNPGVTLVWQTLRHSRWADGRGGWLFDIGKPHAAEWYAHGRDATLAEVVNSIDSGLPLLDDMCAKDHDPAAARAELARRVDDVVLLLPAQSFSPAASGNPPLFASHPCPRAVEAGAGLTAGAVQ